MVSERLEASQHAFVPDGVGFSAQNGRHAFSAHFDGEGVEFVDAAADAWAFRLTPARLGRSAGLAPIEAARASTGDCDATGREDAGGECLRRLELERPGLLEWWQNDEDGMEQGFTVEELPGEGPLLLDLDVDGADVAVSGRTAWLDVGGAQRIQYRGLVATDAAGRELDAHLERTEGGLRIVVDVEGARWPVDIDPTVTTGWWGMGASTSVYYGTSVAGIGDVNGDGYDDIAVGAPSSSTYAGAVYVYHGSASGPATTYSKLITFTTSYSYFGTALAGAGDVNADGYDDLVVGADEYTSGSTDEGAVLVYHGSASGLPSTYNTKIEANSSYAYLGGAVAGAGDVNGDGYDDIVVGARE